jgi:hypothetical protein
MALLAGAALESLHIDEAREALFMFLTPLVPMNNNSVIVPPPRLRIR